MFGLCFSTMQDWSLSAFADEIDADIHVQFRNLNDHGIRLLDLRSAFGKNVMALTDEELKELSTQAKLAGISVNCIGSPINKVTTKEGSSEEELSKLKRAGEIAGMVGTNRIRIFSPEGDDWSVIEPWMAAQVEYAQKNGLNLLHENDGHYFGAYHENAKKLFSVFGCEHFRAAYDFANPIHIGFRAMDDFFPWILPYLETVHLKDFTDGKVVPVGQGDGQVRETLLFLKDQGWGGVLSIEPHLQFAGERSGFTGPESFAIATNTIKELLGSL